MIFEFGKFRVDVDVEATREFYQKHGKTVLEDCGCASCRNYYRAITKVPDKVKSFFDTLGIDPQKSPEATWFHTDEKGVAIYLILFHVVGTMVNEVELYRPVGDTGAFEPIPENYYKLEEGFNVGFMSKIYLLEEKFPKPCIQVEIDARLPWILD